MSQVTNQMANNLTLDVSSAQRSLKELTASVKESNNEWKIQESQLKAAGDTVNASKSRYEGLTQTLEQQKAKVEQLKNGLSNVNTETKKGKDLQEYLTKELAAAERQYNSYNGQLTKAEQAYKYQESGLAKLNDEMRHGNALTDARVQKLEAEGRTEEAQKAKLEGLKSSQANYTKQLEIQQKELKDLSATGDKSSDSYKRQELRVEQMGAKLAQTTGKIRNFNHTDVKPETKGIGHVKSQLESLDDKIKSTKSHFGSIFMGNLLANGVSNALGSVKSKLGEVIREGSEYVKYQSTMKASWDTLTGSAKDGQKMVDMTNDMAQAASNSTEMVDDLNKKLYAVTNSSGETGKLTKSILTLQDAFGVTDDAVKGFGMQWSQMVGNGKVSAQDFMSFTNVFPKIKQQLLEYEQVQTGNHKLSMKQLNDMISGGKISSETMNKVLGDFANKYKDATKNFASTMPGLERTIKARMPAVVAAFEQPLMTMKNPLLKSMGDWVSDKHTEKEFTKLGNSVSKAMGTIMGAFGKEFNSKDFTKGADSFITSLSKSIEKFGDYVAKHKDDIIDFFKMVKSLGATGFSTMATTLKLVLPLLEELGKFAAKHPTTFKVLAGSIIGLNLALKATLGTMALFGKGKAVFGALSGLIIKPKVKGSDAKRELGILGKAGKGIGKAFWWTGKLAIKSVLKSLELLGGAVIKSGKLIGKGLKFTASVATKGAKLAMAGLVKTAKVTGKGIKLAFNFLKANPLILLVTAITAVVIAFAALYKHNKKFRTFINGLVKGAQDFFKGIGKWFGQAWKAVSRFFSKVMNFVKKDWKEILLFIVNPFAGAFALVYKHNAKFRKAINNLVKNVVNFFKDMGKSIGDIFNSIFKNVSKIYNSIKDFIGNTTHNVYKNWVNNWKSIFNFFGDTWSSIKKFGSNSINSLKGTFDDVLGKIGKSFSNTWNGIKDGFSDMWDGMKKLAGDGINAVIKIPNMGIDGINGLIKDFGGPKSALGKIPKVAFANGTGALGDVRRAITKPTRAVLNDGYDSPETGNKEALIHPNGAMEIVQGRNTERLLMPGTEVLKASELAMLMGQQHFAGGTGFLGSIWDGIKGAGKWTANVASSAWDGAKNGIGKFTKMLGFITDAVAHPIKTLEKTFNPVASGMGAMFNGLGKGAFGKVKNQAKDWWSSLWSMAKDSSDSGASAGNKGDDYLFKNKSKDSGADLWGYFYRECVSFVASRLKNLGVSESLFSHLGNGSDWVNAKVPHSKTPKVGDVAVYAAGSEFGNHAAMVTGVQGDKISGEEYNWNGDGKYHTYQGRNKSGATTFLDFGKSAAGKLKEVSASGPMQKLIKGQVGGMFNWIQKFISPLNDSSSGADNDVQSWSGDVKKALSKLGLSTSSSMVKKVLAQIQTESGGNAKAIGGSDGLSDGNATGLMQVKPGTFKANALSGHNDIMNGYDNILAGLNYAKHRYGDSLSFLGQGHGYANGGLITKNQMVEVGEGNKPEMIIPLDGMKSSRGFELLGKTAVAMAQRDGLNNQPVSSDNSALESKLDTMINLLANLVQGQGSEKLVVATDQVSGAIDKFKASKHIADRTALG